ncbi:Os04g0389250 [Oryza sativa Japonica Group]|uniref:Os04g0389250 protein n=1 Tax=Oryza sativa subsp. japonica TaxID=39947 RepID=A0A0P0W9I8_ORYSJ|nr:Os04g0389250 [Oryza sativa Japonica Group]
MRLWRQAARSRRLVTLSGSPLYTPLRRLFIVPSLFSLSSAAQRPGKCGGQGRCVVAAHMRRQAKEGAAVTEEAATEEEQRRGGIKREAEG